MTILIILFAILFIIVPIAGIIITKREKKASEGMEVYFRLVSDLQANVDEEVTKKFLKSRYSLTSYEAALLISMARASQDKYIETFITNKIAENAKK